MTRIWRNLKKNKELLNKAAKSRSFILFDVESTGLKKDDEIIELAACKCYFANGEFVPYDKFHTYIRPSKPVPESAIKIHGITNEFLADKPDAATVFPSICAFMGEMPVVGAYNSGFDVRMLRSLYTRCGEALDISLEIDLLKMVRDVFCEVRDMPNHKLGTIANAYGVDQGIEFHSAMDDVIVSIRVLNSMIKDMKENGCDEQQKKLKVYKINYYEGYRGNSRVYIVTSGGVLYYAFKDDKWAANDPEMDLGKFDMNDVERQVFELGECSDYKELFKKCKDGHFSQEKYWKEVV